MWRSILVWLLLLLLEVMGVVAFAHADGIEQRMRKEYGSTTYWMDEEVTAAIYRQADTFYRSTFIDSGVVRWSYTMFVPDVNNPTNSNPEAGYAKKAVDWFDAKLDTFWAMLLHGAQRLALFWRWSPYLALMFIPVLVDGGIRREIKKTNFGYASPVRYNTGMFILIGLVFVPLAYLFVPLNVTPLFTPIWAVAAAAALMTMAANLQKTI